MILITVYDLSTYREFEDEDVGNGRRWRHMCGKWGSIGK
jgi:hypothetical protein